MNNVVLIGRMVRNPELKYLQTGTAVTNFTIAVDKELSKDKKQEFEAQEKPTADFINIVAWNKTAEAIANFTAKGLKVAVQGRIQTRSWEAEDGTKRYATDVAANQVEFLEWKDKKANTNIPDGFTETDFEQENIPF